MLLTTLTIAMTMIDEAMDIQQPVNAPNNNVDMAKAMDMTKQMTANKDDYSLNDVLDE